jgi:penicillin-binding protein 2
MMSESNRVNLSLIPPRRGWILDRNGQPIASNRADFRVDIIPDRLIDKDKTLAELATILQLSPIDMQDIKDKLDKARGFQPVAAGEHLSADLYAAVSVRQPDLPGVVPQRSFSRFYPAGPCVGHLVGYVGAANAQDYAKEHNPLLITPGFKIGKDGLEKRFDAELRGIPGARRSEVTAGGKIVRDLDTREDVPGKPIHLTINAGLQEYAARRIGTDSGACVVMDIHTGDILAFVSMPSFDPNSFTDGVGRLEWKMLADDDHVPLRNKILHGLFPPGSTVKPTVALAFLEAGLDPNESVNCNGGLQVGNRVFHCWQHHGHGPTNMWKGINQSCDVYFYYFAQKIGMDNIARMMRRMGYGGKFDLPFPAQSFGTVPDPAWKEKKYHKPWAVYDTVNATIGQGYMLVNPLQQAVAASRIASGKIIHPRLMANDPIRAGEPFGVPQEHLDVIRSGMFEVVNGPVRPRRASALPQHPDGGQDRHGAGRWPQHEWRQRQDRRVEAPRPWPFHLLCPFRQSEICLRGADGAWRQLARRLPGGARHHDLSLRQAEGHGCAAPLEKEWGGTPQERMAAKYRSYAAQYGVSAPQVDNSEEAVESAVEGTAENAQPPQPIQTDGQPRARTGGEAPPLSPHPHRPAPVKPAGQP